MMIEPWVVRRHGKPKNERERRKDISSINVYNGNNDNDNQLIALNPLRSNVLKQSENQNQNKETEKELGSINFYRNDDNDKVLRSNSLTPPAVNKNNMNVTVPNNGSLIFL